MDPKLQSFLNATGWSRDELIQKLTAGENRKTNTGTGINCVTSTTTNTGQPASLNHLSSNRQDALRTRERNHNISKTIDKNKEIINVDVDSGATPICPNLDEIPLPPWSATLEALFTDDDLLRRLNTTHSYLTAPYMRTENTRTTKKATVIDLVSDSESVDITETDKKEKRENIIDISTDSDDSVEIVKSTKDPVCNSAASNANDLEPSVKTKPIDKRTLQRLLDKWRDGGPQSKSSKDRSRRTFKDRRRRSASDDSFHEERRRSMDCNSQNGTRRERSRDHRRSRDHSRSRDNSRSRSPSGSHNRRSRSKSRQRSRRSDKSRSKSTGRQIISRKRTRSRSLERDAAWHNKVRKSADQFYPETTVHPVYPQTSYYWDHLGPQFHEPLWIPDTISRVPHTPWIPDTSPWIPGTPWLPDASRQIQITPRIPDICPQAPQTSWVPDTSPRIPQTPWLPDVSRQLQMNPRPPDISPRVPQTSWVPNTSRQITPRIPDSAPQSHNTNWPPDTSPQFRNTPRVPDTSQQTRNIPRQPDHATRWPPNTSTQSRNIPRKSDTYSQTRNTARISDDSQIRKIPKKPDRSPQRRNTPSKPETSQQIHKIPKKPDTSPQNRNTRSNPETSQQMRNAPRKPDTSRQVHTSRWPPDTSRQSRNIPRKSNTPPQTRNTPRIPDNSQQIRKISKKPDASPPNRNTSSKYETSQKMRNAPRTHDNSQQIRNTSNTSSQSTAFKHVEDSFENSTYNGHRWLTDVPRASNNLSSNKNPHSSAYIEFKNIVSEECHSIGSSIESEHKTQKIQLIRRDIKNHSEDIETNEREESFELDADQRINNDSLENVSPVKNFVASKNKNLATEVSKLISTQSQATDQPVTPHSVHATATSSKTGSKNIHPQKSIEIITIDDNDSDNPQELLNAKRESSANIENVNMGPKNKHTNAKKIPSATLSDLSDITSGDLTDDVDCTEKKSPTTASNGTDEFVINTSGTYLGGDNAISQISGALLDQQINVTNIEEEKSSIRNQVNHDSLGSYQNVSGAEPEESNSEEENNTPQVELPAKLSTSNQDTSDSLNNFENVSHGVLEESKSKEEADSSEAEPPAKDVTENAVHSPYDKPTYNVGSHPSIDNLKCLEKDGISLMRPVVELFKEDERCEDASGDVDCSSGLVTDNIEAALTNPTEERPSSIEENISNESYSCEKGLDEQNLEFIKDNQLADNNNTVAMKPKENESSNDHFADENISNQVSDCNEEALVDSEQLSKTDAELTIYKNASEVPPGEVSHNENTELMQLPEKDVEKAPRGTTEKESEANEDQDETKRDPQPALYEYISEGSEYSPSKLTDQKDSAATEPIEHDELSEDVLDDNINRDAVNVALVEPVEEFANDDPCDTQIEQDLAIDTNISDVSASLSDELTDHELTAPMRPVEIESSDHLGADIVQEDIKPRKDQPKRFGSNKIYESQTQCLATNILQMFKNVLRSGHDAIVSSHKSRLPVAVFGHLPRYNELKDTKSLEDHPKLNESNVPDRSEKRCLASGILETRSSKQGPVEHLGSEIEFENLVSFDGHNKITCMEIESKNDKLHDSLKDDTRSVPAQLPFVLPSSRSDEHEDTKSSTDSIEETVEVERGVIKHSKPTCDDVNTPFLDIEAILKKCKENQEKALRAKAALGDTPLNSVVRRIPKKRRPDFKSLRDRSISTIEINLMLEKLSYRNQSEIKDSAPNQQKDISEDSTSGCNKLEPTDLQSKAAFSQFTELATSKINVAQQDGIRNEILKQLGILKDRRNDSAFSACIEPTILPTVTRKKTFAKVRDPITEMEDEEEINIVNDNLESPIIWLTKTADYKKIKGWKNKSIGIKTKKSLHAVVKPIEEDFEVPSCSFHEPSFVDDIIENVVSENVDEGESQCVADSESQMVQGDDADASHAKTNAFSSSMLDEFMLDKSELELKISYEVPELLMGPKINESGTIHENLLKDDAKNDASEKKDPPAKDGNKPKTLAEKRKLLKLDDTQSVLPKSSINNANEFVFIKPPEVNRISQKILGKRTANDDLSNVGHNKRKDFAVGSVYWKSRKYLVPCRERKVIYFRSKITPRYSNVSIDELAPTSNSSDGCPIRITDPPKAVLWSPEKVLAKPVLNVKDPRSNLSYRAGPMCKKPDLIVGDIESWTCVIKSLPKIYLEITAEPGKSIHPRALQFLYAEPFADLCEDKVDFALSALKDSKPTKYKVPVSYENGQTQITLRKKEVIDEIQPKTPPACGDISSEVQDVVDDLLKCIYIQDIQDTLVKDDPDMLTDDKPKEIIRSSNKKAAKESAITTRVAAITRKLRIALGRLQVKFIDINIDEEPNKACDKDYCQFGCVCSSLVGALPLKEHCRRIECVLGCICGYKPPVNTTVTLPAGSNMDLSSTVDKLQSEATKNLAKEEREFTQTIVLTKNETYVLGETTDRKRRCTRTPKKFEDFFKVPTVPKEPVEEPAPPPREVPSSISLSDKYGVDLMDCSVRIEKVDMYHIIPFCWIHEEYQCKCLKEFLIARSEEKANDLLVQWDVDETMKDTGNDLANQSELVPTGTKPALKKKQKKKKKRYPYDKPKSSKVYNSFDSNGGRRSIEQTSICANIQRIDIVGPNVINSSTNKPGEAEGLENQPVRSSSRRKQVLSTMVDINEAHSAQVRLRKEPLKVTAKPVQTSGNQMQNNDGCVLKFLLPTVNVRSQFLKMLGKSEDAKDEFRLLSFLVLSNRFNRNLFHVWFSRATSTSKYILTMDNLCPSPDFINVRYLSGDMKTDNYLIQWLMEGSIPVTEVQDFLVILRIVTAKSFDICGMCEKSKIEYTDEPSSSSSVVLTPPTPSPAKTPPTKTLASAPRASSIATRTYNINGSIRQARKILNIQNEKIPFITCTYSPVALTGQSDLINASLPSVGTKFRWLMLSFSSTFAVLNMTTTNYCIPHEYLVELVEQSRSSNCTVIYKNKDIRGRAIHPEFAIYVTPQNKRFFFIGPYHVTEELTCETLCYYKNMLVSTENFQKIHGNPVTPVGCWLKQFQMKVHTAVSTAAPATFAASTATVSSPSTSILRPILPKPATAPPQLVKISDYMAAMKGKRPILPNNLAKSPKTSLLIVNNSIVSTSAIVKSSTAVASKAKSSVKVRATPINPTVVSAAINAINASVTVPTSKSSPNSAPETALPSANTLVDDICLSGMDYRDAEFKDKKYKTLQYLVTNIPDFGYVRFYKCKKANIIYLMWRFVKMYKTLPEAKKALVSLVESTVILVPSNFKLVITVLNFKPSSPLINGDYFFDTYIAGRFGVYLLSSIYLPSMVDNQKLTEEDVQYINERSSEMLLKKCYNIASTFLTKEDLAKIRNWKDMLAALKVTIATERKTEARLIDELKKERYKRILLQNKFRVLKDSGGPSNVNSTAAEGASDVIEISDEEDDGDFSIMPNLEEDINLVGQYESESSRLLLPEIPPEELPPEMNTESASDQSHTSNVIKTNTTGQQRLGFVSMAQNFQGIVRLMPHKHNSVLISRVKPTPSITKTNTNI